MADRDNPLTGNINDMMHQGFDQTRKAMEQYAELFQKTMKLSPLFGTDLNKATNTYIEKNIAAANEFMRKLSQAEGIPALWQLQNEFIQAQWKNYVEQMKDISEAMTKGTTGMSKDPNRSDSAGGLVGIE